MPLGPPIPNLILVVRIERTRVKHEWIAGLGVHGCVLVPQVAVYEAGFEIYEVQLELASTNVNGFVVKTENVNPFYLFIVG